jgi:hypothetical protein
MLKHLSTFGTERDWYYKHSLLKIDVMFHAVPTIEIECYIQKPVEIKDLVRRVIAELG